MSIEVHRAADRFVTRVGAMSTRHSFSYGIHYDPANVGFGPLVALNDERLPAGTGYDDHRHAATEIVTWVVSGSLHHRDSLGNDAVHGAGTIARASTGSGIVHAERATGTDPVRFLQMMLRPEHVDAEPSYDLTTVPDRDGLHPLVGPGCLVLGVPGACFLAGTAPAGELVLPEAAMLHLFVVEGRLLVGDAHLGPADAARLVGEGGASVQVESRTLIGVWAFS